MESHRRGVGTPILTGMKAGTSAQQDAAFERRLARMKALAKKGIFYVAEPDAEPGSAPRTARRATGKRSESAGKAQTKP